MEKAALDAVMQALEQSSVTECEITHGEQRVRIVRRAAHRAPAVRSAAAVAVAPAPVAGAAAAGAEEITSAWVGFFFRGREKGGKPVCKLRDSLEKGQLVGIVTTANIVHEVFSPAAGKLVEILVEEGHAVQYGQPLMRLAAAGQESDT
jgi:acetyl-CoA carboxylase biotin carboxyl carrier protein